MSHTPGPWTVETPLHFELTIVEANRAAHAWRFIASLPLPETGELARADDIPLKEIEANARLIAVAPELLEAAKLGLYYARLGLASVPERSMAATHIRRQIKIITDAISKAEGATTEDKSHD